jgi:conjugative transfer signal peptidase TraF
VTLVGASVCLGVPWIHPPIRLVYNASPSVALGWYLLVPANRLAVGMFVIARLPPAAARLAADRGYLPITVPVVKRIAAARGDFVCERSRILSIDGRPVARALVEDSEGRPLPAWSGCRDLSSHDYLLLGDGVPDSYDSRYFGPVAASAILGRAIPLWTWR